MRALILAPCMLATSISMAAAQVAVVKAFPGTNGPASGWQNGQSADMMCGVSPKYVVGFINAGFSVRLKADGREVQPFQALDQFWTAAFKNAGGELVGGAYDPRIFYDPLSSRP